MSALSTRSRFYFSYNVDTTNNKIDFDEGGGELTATLVTKRYTLTEIAVELKTQLDSAGALTYTVVVDRATRKLTVSAGATFSLLITTGSNNAFEAFTTIGFTGADVSGASTYEGNNGAGSEYITQFPLQSFVAKDDFKVKRRGVTNESSSGKVELISFGDDQFIQADIQFATDQLQGAGSIVTNNATGLTDLRTLMDFLITKAPVEFMTDTDTPATFSKVILETSPQSSDGIEYRLQEQFTKRLPFYFNTGVLKFRVVT